MSFIHEDRDFNDLLRIVARRHGLAVGLVEKDYWVTHVLWAIHHQGFDAWFKGGTSLFKGFGLIERFSEDLDLKIEPGSVSTLPLVTDWTRENTRATRQRRSYFETLADLLQVAGAEILLSVPDNERRWTSARERARGFAAVRSRGLRPGGRGVGERLESLEPVGRQPNTAVRRRGISGCHSSTRRPQAARTASR